MQARGRVFLDTLGTVLAIRQKKKAAQVHPAVGVLEAELRKKTRGQFGSMVEFILDEWPT